MTADPPGADAPFHFALDPVLVLHAGRSGSTLLMRLLATAPEIGFRREPPFEARHLSYLVRWAQLIGVDEATTPRWKRDAEVEAAPQPGNATAPPTFPWPRPRRGGRPLWHDAFRIAWRAFGARAVRSADYAPGGGARWHAEKTSSWIAESLTELGVPHRRIYLLRDPRDVLLSIWSFNRKRGTRGFGVAEGETIEDFAPRFARHARDDLRVLLELPPNDAQRTIVRYEAMIDDLPRVADELGGWLGVDLDADEVRRDQDRFAGHRTSAGGAPRWSSELSRDLVDLFAATMGPELERLGFAPGN